MANKTHSKLRTIVLWMIAVAAIAVYVSRAFFPGQPIHHQLNEAGGSLIVAWILVLIFT